MCCCKRYYLYVTVNLTMFLARLLLCEFVWITKRYIAVGFPNSCTLCIKHKGYSVTECWKGSLAFPSFLITTLGCKNVPLHPLRHSDFWTRSKIIQRVYRVVKVCTETGDRKYGYVVIIFIIHTYMDFVTWRKYCSSNCSFCNSN